MHCCTTLWNGYAQKSQWHSWVNRTVAQDSGVQNSCWKYSSSDVSIIAVHWRNDIYNGHTKKLTEWLTECICSNQEERRHDKTNKINVHSLVASVSKSQVADSLILVDRGVKINETCYCGVMLLQQLLLAIRLTVSKFFIFQQDCAPALRQSVSFLTQ